MVPQVEKIRAISIYGCNYLILNVSIVIQSSWAHMIEEK